MNSRVLDDGETVQVDIMTVIKANGMKADLEEDSLRRDLRRCYHNFDELCDIHIRLTRKRLYKLSKEQVEDEVIDLARDYTRERWKRVRTRLGELFGGR